MKLLPDDFWPEWEPKPTLTEFALAAAVFVIWLIVGYLYLVLFAVAQ